jgi:hypothetical protein
MEKYKSNLKNNNKKDKKTKKDKTEPKNAVTAYLFY